MKNNTINDKKERIFDAMLKIAADEALREEMDALPNDEELMRMYPSTESLNKKAHAVINREFRGIHRSKVIRGLGKAAAVFCVALVLSAGVLMATPASRNAILNFLIDFRYDHVAIDFDLGVAPVGDGYEEAVEIAPGGFELASSQAMETMTIYVFRNAEGDTFILQRFIGRLLTAGVDIEYADFTEIQLSGRTAHISVALYDGGLSTIMWAHGEDVYSVATDLDVDKLIALAEFFMSD